MSDLTALISNIQRFSTEDGPGIRTTVFFKGCTLRCPWCHNPEGLLPRPQLAFHPHRCIECGECAKVCAIGAPPPGTDTRCKACGDCASACPTGAREIIGRKVSVNELIEEVSRDRAFYGDDGGVTASGGEAAMQADFVKKFFSECKARGIRTALDTSGAIAAAKFEQVIEHADLVLYDIKIMDEQRHLEVIGYPLAPLLYNLKIASRSGKPLWIRFPIVTGYTDDDANVRTIIDFLKKLDGLERVDLLPFHQLGRHKYADMGMPYPLAELNPPKAETVDTIRRAFTDADLPLMPHK